MKLCERYDDRDVDDARASGSRQNGREQWIISDCGNHIRVGTLSKAISVLGDVAGSGLSDTPRRPFLFSTSHPPAVTAACCGVDVLLRS